MRTDFSITFNTYTKKRNVNTKKEEEDEGPIVERLCPKCGNEKMSYATLQLRSADEGQTVFYTCTKCKYVSNIALFPRHAQSGTTWEYLYCCWIFIRTVFVYFSDLRRQKTLEHRSFTICCYEENLCDGSYLFPIRILFISLLIINFLCEC